MRNFKLFVIIFAVVLFACQSSRNVKEADVEAIRINQLGYYPGSVKQFALADISAVSFDIIDEENIPVYSGKLKDAGTWDKSGEKIMLGDFSALVETGEFRVVLDNGMASYPFEIKKDLYHEALKASIKSFYFQRASMGIEEKYGGIYKRAAGHPDDSCIFHASTGKKGILSSPGGWYDAGDYGKYIVNAAITVGQMLNLIEQYPNVVPDGSLDIPESGNDISDLWDEINYELDWMLSMQDEDGGVYHKLTALNFGGFVMPEDYNLDRYIIGKGSASTLNFAAVMAQSSRLYKSIDERKAEQMLQVAQKAWNWAEKNPLIPFRNPEDVRTGQYGDNLFDDDFYWAAVELYLTTGEEKYLGKLKEYNQEYQHQLTNSWKFFIRNMGFHSLLNNLDKLEQELAENLKNKHLKLAGEILNQIEKNPYNIALELYEWGSNSDILNQAMILCYAHRLSGEEKYLKGAEHNTDYIFGKNATAFCFLTGFGSKKVMKPHHRPSGADGIESPVPGFIIGGPNPHKQDAQYVDYKSDFPAKSFEDVQESFASNEVCLNWNAPAVFVLGYIEQIRN